MLLQRQSRAEKRLAITCIPFPGARPESAAALPIDRNVLMACLFLIKHQELRIAVSGGSLLAFHCTSPGRQAGRAFRG